MVWTVPAQRWERIQRVLRETGDRFARLVDDAPDGQAMATSTWTVADVAAHVTAIAMIYPSMVRPDDIPFRIPALVDTLMTTTVDTVSDMNKLKLAGFTERRTAALASQLRSNVDELLTAARDLDPSQPVDWLGGSRVPVAGVLCHLVNELLIHGWDIAKATRQRWDLPPADAALFLDTFIVGMVHHDCGQLLDNDEPPNPRPIAVGFHSRHLDPFTLILHEGAVTVEDAVTRPDVRLRFDPATLNLMLFHRISKARAALTGKVLVSGPRPWLLPRFLRTVRMPS